MGVKGIVCFGVPLLLIIVFGIIGYILGGQVKATPEMTAFAGMIVGGVMGCLILKGYEKKINNNQNKATITASLPDFAGTIYWTDRCKKRLHIIGCAAFYV